MKGRPPGENTVVPMRQDGAGQNFEERAAKSAADLKPQDLPDAVSGLWDRLAPPLCMPNRRFPLDPGSAYMFEMLCYSIERHERLRADVSEFGESYEVETRNGMQQKSRPEVGQMNEAFRQVRGLAAEFGMTPHSARGVGAPGQLQFRFDDDDDFD